MIHAQGGKDNVHGIGIAYSDRYYYLEATEIHPNLPSKDTKLLAEILQRKLNIPVRITQSINATAMAEMTYGAGLNMKNLIMITFGTEVESCIVINGKIVYGSDGCAGKLGHFIIKEHGRTCRCGRKGCLETYCSAAGIVQTTIDFLENSTDDSILRKLNTKELTQENVFHAASRGDRIALEALQYTGKIIGLALADFMAFSCPGAFMLRGNLIMSNPCILKSIRSTFEDKVLQIYRNKAKIMSSQLHNSNLVILGASTLAWQI